MPAQLASLMQEFVALPDVPPETETRLRHFLATKASMCAWPDVAPAVVSVLSFALTQCETRPGAEQSVNIFCSLQRLWPNVWL
jgi:hypothetical protein